MDSGFCGNGTEGGTGLGSGIEALDSSAALGMTDEVVALAVHAMDSGLRRNDGCGCGNGGEATPSP